VIHVHQLDIQQNARQSSAFSDSPINALTAAQPAALTALAPSGKCMVAFFRFFEEGFRVALFLFFEEGFRYCDFHQ